MDYNAFGVSGDCKGILAYAGGEKNGKRGSDREGVVTVESWWGPGRARTAPVRWLVGLGVRFGRLLRVRFGRLMGCLGHEVGASWEILEATWRCLGRTSTPQWWQVGIKIY